MPKAKAMTLDRDFAIALCDAHEVESLMTDQEERELVRDNNHQLYYAYIRLLQIAYPADERWTI
jgi:hypothetical protein